MMTRMAAGHLKGRGEEGVDPGNRLASWKWWDDVLPF